MNRIREVKARLIDGQIVAGGSAADLRQEVMDEKQIVILKNVFPQPMLAALRRAVIDWGRRVPAAAADDFQQNYHRQRAMVSRMQQAPHVFHDYNFNALGQADDMLRPHLIDLFEPLRGLYNELTSREVTFEIPASGPYPHPQIIHYPNGGGFFARHWHNLAPQQLGFIVILSEYGNDFHNGATVFDIDGEIVDLEGRQQIGDICIWRFDYPHWVTQSDLKSKFDWNSEDGRWVATFAYFDPAG